MSLWDYVDKHNWRYPFGCAEGARRVVNCFERCENEEEIEWYKNLVIKNKGIEEWELFKDYCMETEELPHIFPPEK